MSIPTTENLSTREQALEFAKTLTNAQQSALYLATFKYIVDIENTDGDRTTFAYRENSTLFEAMEFLRETGYEFKN